MTHGKPAGISKFGSMSAKRTSTGTDNHDSAKAMKVQCKFCGKGYKAGGLKPHQIKCSKQHIKPREFCPQGVDENAFGHILSFLGNQSAVKLQAITGAHFAGSNVLTSAICCQCENDELAIANGLCLACNRAKNPSFHETLSTTEARKLYGVHDLGNVPYVKRGHFRVEDLQRNAIAQCGSKQAWLKLIAPKALQRQKLELEKRKKDEDYRKLLASFSPGFQRFLEPRRVLYKSEFMLGSAATRFDALGAELNARGICMDDHCRDFNITSFVFDFRGSVNEVADRVERDIQRNERMKREQEEANTFRNTLPKEFVDYGGYDIYVMNKSEIEARYIRYCELTAALRDRGLELRLERGICRNYIYEGEGAIHDAVDSVEEMKFLVTHTSYSSECSSIAHESRYRDCFSFLNDEGYGEDEADYDYGREVEAELRARREQVKTRIRNGYLRNSQGLTLPRKWQRELESRGGATTSNGGQRP